MRILIEGESLETYLAKCHEAFRTGLRALFDTKCFGKGYPGYSRWVRSYNSMINRAFPNDKPDLVIASSYSSRDLSKGFKYKNIDQIAVKKAILLADYWSEAEAIFEQYQEFIDRNGINFIFSYFPQPLSLWKDTLLGERLIYVPPCVDTAIFNDWQMEKNYDVGFLAAGTVDKSTFYPERYIIHQKLLKEKRFRYLWSEHPGWKRHNKNHPLVGKNFSKKINSCKFFITTGGVKRNAHPKYFEILASKSVLMADEPIGAEQLGLEDGVNYIKISENTVIDKLDYYLQNWEICQKISEAGYRLAMRQHSCYARAVDFYEALAPRLLHS